MAATNKNVKVRSDDFHLPQVKPGRGARAGFFFLTTHVDELIVDESIVVESIVVESIVDESIVDESIVVESIVVE